MFVTATCARSSDARIATTASLFMGVFFGCAQRKWYAEIFFKTYMGGWLVGFFSKTKFFL